MTTSKEKRRVGGKPPKMELTGVHVACSVGRKPATLGSGDFAPWEIFGNVYRHFCCHKCGRVLLAASGGGQR